MTHDLATAALMALVCICVGVILEAAVVMVRDWARPTAPDSLAQLARQIRALEVAVVMGGRTMALSLEALEAEVARNTSVDGSAIVLIQGLVAKIEELIAASGNTVDPAALQALVDSLKGSSDGLAAAVAANTPAAPPA